MVDIEAYIKELVQDTEVSAFNIKEVQLKLPAIKHKWAGRQIRAKQELFKLQKKRDKVKKELIKGIIDKAPVNISIAMANQSAETSDTILKMDEEIEDLKLAIELIEKAEKTLSSMTYDISNIVKLMQLEQT